MEKLVVVLVGTVRGIRQKQVNVSTVSANHTEWCFWTPNYVMYCFLRDTHLGIFFHLPRDNLFILSACPHHNFRFRLQYFHMRQLCPCNLFYFIKARLSLAHEHTALAVSVLSLPTASLCCFFPRVSQTSKMATMAPDPCDQDILETLRAATD
jgi:hypothetical protein